ncbi:hypothetical protein D3C72_937450 [compost metagenome]
MVGVPRRQYRPGRGVFPGAGSHRRGAGAELWLYQCLLGHHRRGPGHLPDRLADCLLRGAPWPGHGSADARGRLWLYRLDHYLADLRLVHLHLFCAGSGHHGAGHRAGHRLAAVYRLSLVRRGHPAHGGVWHYLHQPVAVMDAADMAGAAALALCLHRLPGPRDLAGVSAVSGL